MLHPLAGRPLLSPLRVVLAPIMLTPMSDETRSRLLQAGFAVPGGMSDQVPKLTEQAHQCTADDPCPFDADVAWGLFQSMALTPGPVILLLLVAYSVGVQAFSEETEESDEQAERSRKHRQEQLEDLSDDTAESGVWLAEQAERSRKRRQEQLEDLSDDTAESGVWLAEQAERSRKRRQERLRDLSERIQPLEGWFGWELVDKKSGNPTIDAYVFLAIAAALQIAFVLALTAPVRDLVP